MEIAVALHVLSVVIWVGGMFFAYMALRPAAVEVLEPPLRLSLWVATFQRFFPWVWISVIVILTSGLWLVKVLGGFPVVPVYIHIMFGLGLLMMLIFAHVYFAPFRRLKRSVSEKDWASAGRALSQIRVLVGVNLTLGLITVAVATAGRLLVS